MSTLSQFSGGGIKSIQRGVISTAYPSTSNTVTISAVDTNKTMLNYLGASIGNAYIRLTNSTTITIDIRYEFSLNSIISYEVIEFY